MAVHTGTGLYGLQAVRYYAYGGATLKAAPPQALQPASPAHARVFIQRRADLRRNGGGEGRFCELRSIHFQPRLVVDRGAQGLGEIEAEIANELASTQKSRDCLKPCRRCSCEHCGGL